jgi:hypothetical protein
MQEVSKKNCTTLPDGSQGIEEGCLQVLKETVVLLQNCVV